MNTVDNEKERGARRQKSIANRASHVMTFQVPQKFCSTAGSSSVTTKDFQTRHFLLPKSQIANSLGPFNFLPEINLISRGFSHFATRTSIETKTSWKELQRDPTRRKALAPNSPSGHLGRCGENNTARPH